MHFSNWSLFIILTRCFFKCAADPPPLVITSVLAQPFLMIVDDPSLTGNDRYEGFSKDLIDKLFERLDRSYILEVNAEGTYGVRDTNGSWNGMIGKLMAGEADLAVADLTVSRSRSIVVDFSVPFMQARLAILMKKPIGDDSALPEDRYENSILNQFSASAWLLIGCTVALTLLVHRLLDKYVSKRVLKIYPKWVKIPLSLQCLQFGFVIFLIFVIAALAGNFLAGKLASLIVQSRTSVQTLPVTSIQELGNQTEIEFGILRSGSTFNYFKSSMSDDLIESMYRDMVVKKGLLGSYDEGIKRVRNSNGSFAFLMESHAAKFATVRKPCDLGVAQQLFGHKKGYGVAVPKDSTKLPLRDIDIAILDLNEQGILSDLENKWFKDQTECDEEIGKEFRIEAMSLQPLDLRDMELVFAFLALAVALILCFSVYEYFVIRK